MDSAVVNKGSSEIKVATNKGLQQLSEMEDDEDLFEINIEAVNSIPPPHYCESYFTSTGSNTLLANCLLPISDVSSAIPLVSAESLTSLLMVAESVPILPAKVIGIPCMGALGVEQKEMSA